MHFHHTLGEDKFVVDPEQEELDFPSPPTIECLHWEGYAKNENECDRQWERFSEMYCDKEDWDTDLCKYVHHTWFT